MIMRRSRATVAPWAVVARSVACAAVGRADRGRCVRSGTPVTHRDGDDEFIDALLRAASAIAV
jgi:hypothetical protein